MQELSEGRGLIAGRGRENARAALQAAADAGVDASEVLAVDEGYSVPLVVLDFYHGIHAVLEESVPVPDAEWKNAEIKQWAQAHDVDLGDASTKADMLAAISTADTKEE